MRNRIVRILIGITAAGMMLTGCSIPGASDSASEGRTTLISDTTEEETEPVEEMEAGVEFDKWYSTEQPGIPQNVNVDDYLTTEVDTSNLTVSEEDLVPSDDQIKESEQNYLDNYATESDDTSLEAKDGDRVVISYEGVADGVTLEGYTADKVSLRIGNGTMSTEFEEKLIGMHPGDTRNITVTYDENYTDENVAGKTVIFSVSMESVYVCAEFDDEFVSTYTEYKTVNDYEKAYKEQYRASTLRQKAYDMIGELADTVEEYPEEYLEAYKNLLKGFDQLSYDYAMSMYEAEDGEEKPTFEEYMNDIYGDDYDSILDTHAKGYVSQQLAFIKVGQALGIEFTSDDYSEYIADKGVLDSTIQQYGEGYISSSLYEQFVLEELVGKLKIS